MCQGVPHTMEVHHGRPTGGTVLPRLTLVNSLVTVDTEQGDRLRAYIDARWPRSRGGMRGFCRAAGMTPETLYSWFRGETSPSFDNLGAIAEALGVRRFEIVAAMDGEAPVVRLDPTTRDAVRAEIQTVLEERGLR